MTSVQPFWLAGLPTASNETADVSSPHDGRVIARIAIPNSEQVEQALMAAAAVGQQAAALPLHIRAAALDHVSRQLGDRVGEIAKLITSENGKPLKWARVEVLRAASVFRWAAEEARRWSGEVHRLDTDVSGEGRLALIQRFPRGPILAIPPFNFPLNLVAHKVAPAVAVGAPIIVKPAPKTPLSALLLGELLAETDLPSGMVSVLTVPDERAAALVVDDRLPVISFTGSGPVGWQIRDSVPGKHVTLELGGTGTVVVCADWNGEADLDHAASQIATFSNYQAGQSCIAVQRVLAEREIYEALVDKVVAAVAAQRMGDPNEELTDVGPMINESAARRVGRGSTMPSRLAA